MKTFDNGWTLFRDERAKGAIVNRKGGESVFITNGAIVIEVIYWGKRGNNVRLCLRANDPSVKFVRRKDVEQMGLNPDSVVRECKAQES